MVDRYHDCRLATAHARAARMRAEFMPMPMLRACRTVLHDFLRSFCGLYLADLVPPSASDVKMATVIPTQQKHKLQRSAYWPNEHCYCIGRSFHLRQLLLRFLIYCMFAAWTYWELRAPWQGKGQDWGSLPTSLFDADTVEDFWIRYIKTPKITYVLCHDI